MGTAGPSQGETVALGGGSEARAAVSAPPPAGKVRRRALHGVLLLDKPLGWSSNDILQKVGHTGTLDPLASGVLPLCFGAATKFSQLQLDADKAYEARLLLGVRTSTGDAEGEVLERRVVQVSAEDVQRVLPQFLGSIAQVPPMYSALKRMDARCTSTHAPECMWSGLHARSQFMH